MEADFLIGHNLESVWVSRIQIPPAWINSATPAIQSLFVNLACSDIPVGRVLPCEVEIPERYPALGIELTEVSEMPDTGRWYEGTQVQCVVMTEIVPFLPATIIRTRLWDSLGEGPDSALDIVLSSGVTLTIRHIMPPMILGIELNRAAVKQLDHEI